MDKKNGADHSRPHNGIERHTIKHTNERSVLDAYDPQHESFLTPAARKLHFLNELNAFMDNQKQQHALIDKAHKPHNKS